MPRRRPKRKVSFKRYKTSTENTNRRVVLWDGKPAPFIVKPPQSIHEDQSLGFRIRRKTERSPEFTSPRIRDISPKQWFKMVKENESGTYNRQKKKRSKK